MTQLVTTDVAAKASGVTPRTIRRWANDGRITSESRGGVLYVELDEIDQVADMRGNGGRLPKARKSDVG